jgi:hypothetical protein
MRFADDLESGVQTEQGRPTEDILCFASPEITFVQTIHVNYWLTCSRARPHPATFAQPTRGTDEAE